MPILSRALFAAIACLLLASPAPAAITDPELSCAAWLKTISHKPKAQASATNREAAAVEARIRAFCAANPKMKAVDAEMTVTGD
jgi:hypothetical protein